LRIARIADGPPERHNQADMLDTTAVNRKRQDFAGLESVWLFGYGSLIYKVDFPFLERRPARIRGWSRRLWQGSHDHRGTPRQPGRVATLIPEAGATCVGMAYRVTPATFEQLDFREKNGYLRSAVMLDFGGGASAEGVVYIASSGNAAWLGPADDATIARHVMVSSGPSGSNADYVLGLAAALRELGADDPHVFAVEARLRGLRASA
jgi:cation transport regulator ChaC